MQCVCVCVCLRTGHKNSAEPPEGTRTPAPPTSDPEGLRCTPRSAVYGTAVTAVAAVAATARSNGGWGPLCTLIANHTEGQKQGLH
jgi:hypothetical protein